MKLSPVLAALVLFATPAAAERRQHGNLVYDVPPGWSLGAVRDGAQTLISDLPDDRCEFCYIHLTEGKASRGRLPLFLKSQRLRFVDEDDHDAVTLLDEPQVIEAEGRQIGLLGVKAGGEIQIHYAAKIEGRLELMVFTGPADDAEELAETMATFESDVSPMFDRVAFVSEGTAPMMPPAEPGDLSGLWWGFTTRWTLGMDMMMVMDLDHRHITFWPDGHFYDGTPPAGLQPLDPPALLGVGDMDFGTYAVRGRTLTLTFATGETEVFDADDEAWEAGELLLTKVEPLPDGATFAGGLSSIYATGFAPGSGVSGGVSSSSYTTFNADGTFTGGRFSGAFGNFDNGSGYSVGSESDEAGRYTVKDGLLIRTPSDGSAPDRDLIFRLGDDIMIGSQTLEQ